MASLPGNCKSFNRLVLVSSFDSQSSSLIYKARKISSELAADKLIDFRIWPTHGH